MRRKVAKFFVVFIRVDNATSPQTIIPATAIVWRLLSVCNIAVGYCAINESVKLPMLVPMENAYMTCY